MNRTVMWFTTAAAVSCLTMVAPGRLSAADQQQYNIRQFGAKGDGITTDTQSIQKAIDACAKVGGGTVNFPPGTYRAGSVYLRSNVTLHLQAGATLLQSRDLKDYVRAQQNSYVHHTASHHAFLHGKRVKDVSIVGKGTIDGNKGDVVKGRDPRGPLSIIFENSENILVKGITVVDSPGWSVTFSGCKNVNILDVKCLKSFADGINCACCRNVLYDGVLIDGSGDDAVTLKNDSTGYSYETRPDCGYLSENITVKNTTIRNTGHPAVKIGTGSYGVFRNIVVKNCIIENTGDLFTIQLMRPKYEQTPERTIENIAFSNIVVKNVGRLLDVTSIDIGRPIIRDISFDNITAVGIREPSLIYGLPDAPISNFKLSNIRLKGTMQPCWLKARYLHGLKLSNVQLELNGVESALVHENGTNLELNNVSITGALGNGGRGPLVKVNQVRGVLIRGTRTPTVGTFLYAEGNKTTNISFASNDPCKAKVPFAAAVDVPDGAVVPAADNVEYANLRVSERIKANEPFNATVTATNTGNEGAVKIGVCVDGKPAGSKWCWLNKRETRRITLLTHRYYKPGSYKLTVGHLQATATVEPTSAAFEFGEKMKIISPAAAGELTVVAVALKNIGGRQGTKDVELHADGKVVASRSVTLAPGEQKEVTIEHTFKQAGPHKLKIGDFPVWPFATFANTKAGFYQTRKKIIIEAGGGRHDIRKRDREYAAVYVKDVKGDFTATTAVLSQQVTGPYAGGGLIVKNDLSKPADDSGCVIAWRYPKYDVASFERPMAFRIAKTGKTFKGATYCVSPGDADIVQDVGIFANAYSATSKPCRVEFQHFTVDQK